MVAMEGRINKNASRRPAIGFLFVGGLHQMLHIAPVAAELLRRGELTVRGFVYDRADASALRGLTPGLAIDIVLLPVPFWAKPWRMVSRNAPLKLPCLVSARRRLGEMDILVAAERTSTILKRLPGRKPFMVHIPHGAGDRAQGFEARIRLFDHVIVAGPKDRARMIAENLVRSEDCSISGYIKLDTVQARGRSRTPLFTNGRPTVLYNPHFARKLSSWDAFGRVLISAFRQHDEFNLIVAPHVRLAERLSDHEQATIRAMAVEGRIIIDLGSPRSSDMTYTLGADIYVGDVSSQVYEFLSEPRPCVFLNPGVRKWQDNPDYAFWHFGAVVSDPLQAFRAIAAAAGHHPHYIARQVAAVSAAFGPEGSAVARAADILAALARQRVAEPTDHLNRS
ncbi:MAG TPA: glycosyl transferase [Sphingomonas sp.]|nr:glycosyl transferase [Sphingomonas sp.]